MLARLPRVTHPDLLVGYDTADDAGVYRLTPDLAIVQTVDFFTPIVDDPLTFGAIAAANALSDVYAMGATPITALSVLAWPGSHDLDDLEQVVQGGASKIHEAGCLIIGGHSIADPEIKFGYAITGTVHPDRVRTNAGARPGDVLVLTKPLGTGLIATALKKGIARPEHVQASIDGMLTLNRLSAESIRDLDVHAVTDVTGFGLLGHAREVAVASAVTLEICSSKVPFLPGAVEYARAGALAGGLTNNREFTGPCVEGSSEFDDLLYDPQTSGGLLISIAAKDAPVLASRLPNAVEIGSVHEKSGKPLRIL
ncbi:MAG: selenide, water dikinase SelD [Bryobacterales bacterium]|nr:selenide, water dikinase SelD [Bryobacterales bacterium]